MRLIFQKGDLITHSSSSFNELEVKKDFSLEIEGKYKDTYYEGEFENFNIIYVGLGINDVLNSIIEQIMINFELYAKESEEKLTEHAISLKNVYNEYFKEKK